MIQSSSNDGLHPSLNNNNAAPENALSSRLSCSAIRTGLVGLSSVFILAACDFGSGEPVKPPSLPVKVVDAEQRDVTLYLEMVGTTLGSQDVPIRARVEGFLESMDFAEGTYVKKGDLLYTIDDEPFLAKVVEAESQLAAARTNLAKADADLSRIEPLAKINAVSEQDLDAAVASEAASRAGVRASEAAVDLAKISLSYTRMFAPIDGLIGITKARPGEFVGREPNPVVLNTLSDIDPIRVRFSIAEREYLILARTYLKDDQDRDGRQRTPEEIRASRPDQAGARRGNDPDLTLLLADGSVHPFKGAPIASAQSIDVETGTYTVEAAFPNPNWVLLPGQFARVKAQTQTLSDVIVIPRQALVELQGLFRVYIVADDGTVTQRAVKLGPTTGDDVVIEDGLSPGETVIVEGVQKVRPGVTVTPQPFKPEPEAS